jgi:glucose/arabinose dehydrogenase
MGGAVAKIVGFRLVLAVCALAAPFAALARPEAEPGYTVDTIADGFKHPWSLAFLPDGGMLVTERPGRISVIRAPAAGSPASRTPVSGVPPVYENNQAGLFEVVLHPRFADNRLVYLSYVQGHGLSNTLRVSMALPCAIWRSSTRWRPSAWPGHSMAGGCCSCRTERC